VLRKGVTDLGFTSTLSTSRPPASRMSRRSSGRVCWWGR